MLGAARCREPRHGKPCSGICLDEKGLHVAVKSDERDKDKKKSFRSFFVLVLVVLQGTLRGMIVYRVALDWTVANGVVVLGKPPSASIMHPQEREMA